MNTRVNYIVANYIGPLRTYAHYQDLFNKDPLCFFRKHLDFLQTVHNPDQISTTFVFNDDIDPVIKRQLDDYYPYKFEVLYRKNSGFSYGIWNDTIIKHLNIYDYFFLIEDDYIPVDKNFIEPFRERCVGNTAFVCGLVEEASLERFPGHVSESDGRFPFPSISNGLLSAAACREVFNKHGTVFKINYRSDYQSAYTNQIQFCKHFTDMGYGITDILDEYSSPYNNATKRELTLYGSNDRPLLQPIII